MRGLKVFLFLNFLVAAVYGLMGLFLPAQLAEWKMGPQDVVSGRYMGALFIGLTVVALYAFISPKKNAAVVNGLITLHALTLLIGLLHGFTGAEEWALAIVAVIMAVVLGGGLVLFYPKGEKPT